MVLILTHTEYSRTPMSVLIEFSMFPTGRGESLSKEVSDIIEMIRGSGYDYQLTAMGTLVETLKLSDALELVEKAYQILEQKGCHRVYATIKLDIRKHRSFGLTQKIRSIEDRIGEVSK